MIYDKLIWYYGALFLYMVPIILIVSVLLVRRYLWQKRTGNLLGSTRLLRNFSLVKKVCKTVLLIFGLLFLVLALARPQWGDVKQTVSQEGRDVLIALDISRSMLAQDIKPSRLERAKTKIKELLERLTAERVSFMVFSGMAIVQCPFTTDMDAFMNFLDLADVESISTGTTALDKALSVALDMFESVPGRKQRIMIIFTDGEDFSTDLSQVQERAKKLGLHIFTVGIGTLEGAPIPLYDEKGVLQGHQKDEQGAVVITRRDDQQLAQLAQKTGGAYIPFTENDTDVTQLVTDVQRFEKEKFDDKTFAVKKERYGIFAGISLLLLLLEWVL